MGGRSAKLQKQLFPRSKTKLEALRDKITGGGYSYPAVPASTLNVQVDPNYTEEYSDLLKRVASNLASKSDNFRFKDYKISHIKTETQPEPTPTGLIDRELLTRMFVTEKGKLDLHSRVGLTQAELDKVFMCYSGYKTRKLESNEELFEQMLGDSNEVPMKKVNTPAMMLDQLSRAETRRLKESKESSPAEHSDWERSSEDSNHLEPVKGPKIEKCSSPNVTT